MFKWISRLLIQALPLNDKDIEIPKLLFLVRACPEGPPDALVSILVTFSFSCVSNSLHFSCVPIAFFKEAILIAFSSPLSAVILFLENALLNIGANEFEVKVKLETIDELLLALLCLHDGVAPSPILPVEETEVMNIALVDSDLVERAAVLALICLSAGDTVNKHVADAFRLCDLGASGEKEYVLTCVTSGFANDTARRAGRREVGDNMLYSGNFQVMLVINSLFL